jgi:hypothetical protein
MALTVHAARRCCQSRPRCAACPTLLKRPEQQGVAQRTSRNTYVICDLGAKAMAKARARQRAPDARGAEATCERLRRSRVEAGGRRS